MHSHVCRRIKRVIVIYMRLSHSTRPYSPASEINEDMLRLLCTVGDRIQRIVRHTENLLACIIGLRFIHLALTAIEQNCSLDLKIASITWR
jgi:hypothetical protein